MTRNELRKFFKVQGTVILPVIHVLDNEQAERNVRFVIGGGAQGVFLINHDFPPESFLPIIRHLRSVFPQLWLGVNFLAITGKDAFPVLGELERSGCLVNAYWADNARIDETRSPEDQPEASEIEKARQQSDWSGLYFGGTAFKKQREVPPDKYGEAARIACNWMDVVTTSGIATGHAADQSKIVDMRAGCGDTALALASGVTPENAADYAKDADCFLVATGINVIGDFYNIDPEKLAALMAVVATP